MKGTYYQMSVTSKERTEISSKQVITKISSGLQIILNVVCVLESGKNLKFIEILVKFKTHINNL